MNNPTKIVNELIYDYNLNIEEAIDIEDLISKMNIRLVSTELEEGILGASKVEGLKRLIVISSKVYNEEQKRFTLAHELGHILIHRGTHYFSKEDLSTICTSKQKEDEADRFAVELLLPSKIIRNIIKENDVNFELIKQISKKYRTSLTSTAIRVAELTNENIILLYHKNNTIKWWHKSNGEIFFNERYKGIDLARIEQERDIPSRNVELNLWLSEDEDLYSCYEETIYFNKLNDFSSNYIRYSFKLCLYFIRKGEKMKRNLNFNKRILFILNKLLI